MDKGKTYEVKSLSLASQGRNNMELAELNMGALLEVKKRFEKEKPLKGVRIGLALHVTKETGVLVRTLIAGGADVAITGCNPLSTQDDVAAALAEEGVRVWAYKGKPKKIITGILIMLLPPNRISPLMTDATWSRKSTRITLI